MEYLQLLTIVNMAFRTVNMKSLVVTKSFFVCKNLYFKANPLKAAEIAKSSCQTPPLEFYAACPDLARFLIWGREGDQKNGFQLGHAAETVVFWTRLYKFKNRARSGRSYLPWMARPPNGKC
jgi:hypothetical protein